MELSGIDPMSGRQPIPDVLFHVMQTYKCQELVASYSKCL